MEREKKSRGEGEGEWRRGRERVESGGEVIGEWRRGRKRLLETDVARKEESTEREKESTVE